MSPPPRMSNPPQTIRARLVAVISDWRVIGAALASLILAGVAWGSWSSDLITRSDLDRQLGVAASERAVLRSETGALRERVTRGETDTAWLKATVYEIAKKVGATTVPPPP